MTGASFAFPSRLMTIGGTLQVPLPGGRTESCVRGHFGGLEVHLKWRFGNFQDLPCKTWGFNNFTCPRPGATVRTVPGDSALST
jgi:hypothetical protein